MGLSLVATMPISERGRGGDCLEFGDSKFIPDSKCEKVCSLGGTAICSGTHLTLIKTSH